MRMAHLEQLRLSTVVDAFPVGVFLCTEVGTFAFVSGIKGLYLGFFDEYRELLFYHVKEAEKLLL